MTKSLKQHSKNTYAHTTLHTHIPHFTDTHIPHYTYITDIPSHLDTQDFNTQQSLKFRILFFWPSELYTFTNFSNFKFKFSASIHSFPSL